MRGAKAGVSPRNEAPLVVLCIIINININIMEYRRGAGSKRVRKRREAFKGAFRRKGVTSSLHEEEVGY